MKLDPFVEPICPNFYYASSNFLLKIAFCFDKSAIILSVSSLVLEYPTPALNLVSVFSYDNLKFSFSKPSTLSSSSAILSSFSSIYSSGAPIQLDSKFLILSFFYSSSISKHFTASCIDQLVRSLCV